jgi:pyruvate formate lyase activating enzyme
MSLGLQKISLIDYPGKIACVVFFPGCDLACPFCHNPELARPERFPGYEDGLFSEDEALSFLKKRSGVLEGVVFSGGEATLSPRLTDMIRAARDSGYLVKVDTNGMHPETLENLDADFVALDFKTSLERYPSAIPGAPADSGSRLTRSLEIVRSRRLEHEIRSTLVPGFIGHLEISSMAESLHPEEDWILQNFRPGRTLDPEFSRVQPYTEAERASLLDLARTFMPRARLR